MPSPDRGRKRGWSSSVEKDLDREGRVDAGRRARERRRAPYRGDRRLVELRVAARSGEAQTRYPAGGTDGEGDDRAAIAPRRRQVMPDGRAHRCRIAA